MRLASAIYYDVKIQFRSGFYLAYLIVCLIYIAGLRQLPGNIIHIGTTIVVFLDPTILGFFFIGGLILLERGQKTLSGIFVTPFTITEYLLSKAFSLTLLALLSSLLITIAVLGMNSNIFLFCITIILTSIMFVFMGIAIVVRVRDLNRYLILSPLPLIFFIVPLLDYLDIVTSDLFYLLPSYPVIKLLAAALDSTAQASLFNFIPLFLWLIITFLWAFHWFKKYVVEKTGD